MKGLLLAAVAGACLVPRLAAAAPAALLPLPLATVEQGCEALSQRLGSVALSDCLGADFRMANSGSVEGRPILVRDFPPTAALAEGAPAPRILLFGGIHGDEYSAVSIMFRWIELLKHDRFQRYDWRVIPSLNPDGLLNRPATRVNANGVDLNRNFPSADWEERALPYWRERTFRDPRRYPGKAALSEPESAWLADEIRAFMPDVIVSVHAPLGVLDFDGPPPPPDRLGYLRLKHLGVYPGSLGNFAGMTLGIPVLTPELPHAGIMPSGQQVQRMWADLNQWLDGNVEAAEPPPMLLRLDEWEWAPRLSRRSR